MMKIVAFAGGVGGAKLAHGLSLTLPPEALTIVVNTGDDFTHLGLKICPDLDTVCYTLAGLANLETGWGRADETNQVMQSLRALGGAEWFFLGDRDLATHLWRTQLLRDGAMLSQITRQFCAVWGVQARVLPMSDDEIQTLVHTREKGILGFQEYFVRERCQPSVTGFEFNHVEKSTPADGVLEALRAADGIIICPSNPWVSIGPILAVPGIRDVLLKKPVIAVSPLIQGQALKGPAAKMYQELGFTPDALSVAKHYQSLLAGFVMDTLDTGLCEPVSELGIEAYACQTIMRNTDDRIALAEEVVSFLSRLIRRPA